MIYCISDLHLGHTKLCKDYPVTFPVTRKYGTVEEMEQDIIANWNYTVNDDDTVIFLGDLAWPLHTGKLWKQKAPDITRVWNGLAGNKVFLKGNHDEQPFLNKDCFERTSFVVGEYCLVHNGRLFHFRHYPYLYSSIKMNEVYVHGHTHSTVKFDGLQNNVSWEAWYRPVSLDELKSPEKLEEK